MCGHHSDASRGRGGLLVVSELFIGVNSAATEASRWLVCMLQAFKRVSRNIATTLIVVLTENGHAANLISKYRPPCLVVVASSNAQVRFKALKCRLALSFHWKRRHVKQRMPHDIAHCQSSARRIVYHGIVLLNLLCKV